MEIVLIGELLKLLAFRWQRFLTPVRLLGAALVLVIGYGLKPRAVSLGLGAEMLTAFQFIGLVLYIGGWHTPRRPARPELVLRPGPIADAENLILRIRGIGGLVVIALCVGLVAWLMARTG